MSALASQACTVPKPVGWRAGLSGFATAHGTDTVVCLMRRRLVSVADVDTTDPEVQPAVVQGTAPQGWARVVVSERTRRCGSVGGGRRCDGRRVRGVNADREIEVVAGRSLACRT
jgi:hypothetical protein